MLSLDERLKILEEILSEKTSGEILAELLLYESKGPIADEYAPDEEFED